MSGKAPIFLVGIEIGTFWLNPGPDDNTLVSNLTLCVWGGGRGEGEGLVYHLRNTGDWLGTVKTMLQTHDPENLQLRC